MPLTRAATQLQQCTRGRGARSARAARAVMETYVSIERRWPSVSNQEKIIVFEDDVGDVGDGCSGGCAMRGVTRGRRQLVASMSFGTIRTTHPAARLNAVLSQGRALRTPSRNA